MDLRGVDLSWILAFQSLGDWLLAPMRFFSALGIEEFYLAALPFLYWCVEARLGLRVGVIMLFSSGLNAVLKMPFHGPRPYWVSPAVEPLWSESSFGLPSGHAQQAVAVWGFAAATLRTGWVWLPTVVVMLLIGLSRAYLGSHFFLDILAGWSIGGLLLWLFQRFWDPVAAWARAQSTGAKIAFAFLACAVLVVSGAALAAASQDFHLPAVWLQNAARAGGEPLDPLSLNGVLSSAGTLFGMLAGVAWMDARASWQVAGPWWARAIRYVLGMLGVLALWYGLGQLFPRGEALLPLALRFARYALLGAWVSAGAPLLFRRVGLS